MENTPPTNQLVFQQLGLPRRRLHRIYEAVLFARSLTQCCLAHEAGRTPDITLELPRNAGQERGFYCLVNKLCLVCDNEHGGSKMTSLAVLQSTNGIAYVFASNQRSPEELESVTAFLKSLFDILRTDGVAVSTEQDRYSMRTSLLRHVLSFNKTRVMCYVRGLWNDLNMCLSTLDENEEEERRALIGLRELAGFHSDGNLDDIEWLHSVDVLMSALEGRQRTLGFINERAMASDHDSSWAEVRHFIGRLRSYGSAVTIFLEARLAWAELFRNINILFIPSSTPLGNPFPPRGRNCTAADIIGRLVAANEIALCRDQARGLQQHGLDDTIRKSCLAESFSPILHAEILIFDILERTDSLRAENFFGGWMYIGGSKPTCRLCSSYLSAHPANVKFRPSHGNIYTGWRMPGTYVDAPSAGPRAEENRLEAIRKVTDEMRQICKQTLSDQQARKKKHDSLTTSSVPSCWDNVNRGLSIIGDVQHMLENLSLRTSSSDTHPDSNALPVHGDNRLLSISESG